MVKQLNSGAVLILRASRAEVSARLLRAPSITSRTFGPCYRSYLQLFSAKYSIWCQQAPVYIRSSVIVIVCIFHSILTINQWKQTFQKWTNDQSAERKYVCHCCVAQVTSLVFTFDFYQRLQSDRLDSMANDELDSSDSGGSEFAGFDEEETRRRIGETTRVIGETTRVIGEPTRVIGEPTRVIGEPTRVIGEPTRVIGEPTRVIGEPTRVIGEPTRVIGEPTRVIGEPTRVIGAARATVGVTVSESDSDSSDATIVEITGTVIVKPIVHLHCKDVV